MAKSTVTPLEHTLIGGVGGVMEVFMMQPMVAFKNAMQEGRPMPRGPVELYRGLMVRGAVCRESERRRRRRVCGGGAFAHAQRGDAIGCCCCCTHAVGRRLAFLL